MSQLRDEILIQKIVDKIKKLRAQHEITLEQFYNDTNINLSRIESSKANMSVSTLNAICKYFKVSLSEFLKGV
jgi:transcriptional regulator with XRE-family HTH domain